MMEIMDLVPRSINSGNRFLRYPQNIVKNLNYLHQVLIRKQQNV